MSNSIILRKKDGGAFDGELLKNVLSSCRYASAVTTANPNYDLQCDLRYRDSCTTIRVPCDRGAVWIEGTGIAGLHAALVIQSVHAAGEILAIDQSYSFDLTLSEFSSADELNAKIHEIDGLPPPPVP